MVDKGSDIGTKAGNYRIVTEFTVCTDGSICDVILKDSSTVPYFNESVLKIVKKYNNWQPAINANGELIRSTFSTPISFVIMESFNKPKWKKLNSHNFTIHFSKADSATIKQFVSADFKAILKHKKFEITNEHLNFAGTVKETGFLENIKIEKNTLPKDVLKVIVEILSKTFFEYSANNINTNNKKMEVFLDIKYLKK